MQCDDSLNAIVYLRVCFEDEVVAMRGILLSVLASLVLSGCVATPPQLRGDFVSADPARASLGEFAGAKVRWAGIVVGERLADSGNCLEVAAFPIDSNTLKPYESGLLPYQGFKALFADGRFLINGTQHRVPPRFLACTARSFDRETYPDFSVVTLVGTLATPRVFQVALADCGSSRKPSPIATVHSTPMANPSPEVFYAGNVHAANDRACVVSMAVVDTNEIVAWTEPPSV